MNRESSRVNREVGNRLFLTMIGLAGVGFISELTIWLISGKAEMLRAALGFGLCTGIGLGIYLLFGMDNGIKKFANHLSAFYYLLFFIFAAKINPIQYHDVWIFFLFYPILISIYQDRKVYWIWNGFAILLYTGFNLVDPTLSSKEYPFIILVNRALLASGSISLGWLLIRHLANIRNHYAWVSTKESIEQNVRTIYGLVPIVEQKSHTSRIEIDKMSNLMKGMLRHISKEKIADWEVEFVSLLHYVSRIKMADYLFEKSEKLTEYEYRHVQDHCTFAIEILDDAPIFKRVKEALLYHHERIDGKGYPAGIGGDSIPLLARVLSVAECYFALTSTRSYRKSMNAEEAYVEIVRNAGSAFDPKVVDALGKELGITIQSHNPLNMQNVTKEIAHAI